MASMINGAMFGAGTLKYSLAFSAEVINYLCLCLQEVMNTICSPNGQVLRIVIFKKNGVQCMVEYPFLCGIHRSIKPP